MHQPVRNVLLAGSGGALAFDDARPSSWPSLSLHPNQYDACVSPSPVSIAESPEASPKTKNIFINIERNATPRRVAAEHTDRTMATSESKYEYCVLQKDHDMYTLLLDEDIVKDVYVNYERIRSNSL